MNPRDCSRLYTQHDREAFGALVSVFHALYFHLFLPVLVPLLLCVLWISMIFDCMKRGVCCQPCWPNRHMEGGHSAISSRKNLSSSSPAPCSLCSGQYRQLRAISIYAQGCELVDLESSCSHVSLTHEVYSQISKPYLNDFIWYSFLLVLGSVPLFCAVSFSFKGLGNYCNPKGK